MARFAAARAPRALPVDGADVVAVVPARDEAAAVGACVRALRATGVREVVVVDDWSGDATAAVAAAAGARVVAAPALPAGAVGKPAACRAGAGATAGEWLWFVDADVVVAPDAPARLLAVADETGAALVSAFGRVATPTAGAAWLLPEVGLGLARRLAPGAVADPASPAAFASGQCLLVRRAAYDAAGGHDVRAVVEDVALARAVKARGYGVRVVLAPDMFETALYGSLVAAWPGLRKSARVVRPRLAVEAAWALAAVAPLLAWRTRAGRAAYVAQVVVSAGGRAVSGAPVWPAVAAPFAEVWLFANRLAAARRRPVAWRGRAVRP